MKNQILGDKKEERSSILMAMSDENQKRYNESYIGKEIDVLFEEDKKGIYKGHTANYILAYCKTNQKIDNQIIKVKCINIETGHILVEL